MTNHPHFGPCQTAGGRPVLKELAMPDLLFKALLDSSLHLWHRKVPGVRKSPGTYCILSIMGVAGP